MSLRAWPFVFLALGGCARVGVAPPGPADSLPACRVAESETRAWRIVDDPVGVRYRLPTGFVERSWPDQDFREFRVDQELSGRVMVGLSPSPGDYLNLRRVPSPPMRDLAECVDGPPGPEVVLQTWRTDGGRFRDGQRSPLYEALALIPLEPSRTLFVTGGGSTPAFQEIIFAIARSVEITSR